MSGFKSNWYLLPDSGIGAVLLTNSDNRGMLLGPFSRRLLEVVFDGKPEAVADVASRAATHKAELAKDRERLVVPPAPIRLQFGEALFQQRTRRSDRDYRQGSDCVRSG